MDYMITLPEILEGAYEAYVEKLDEDSAMALISNRERKAEQRGWEKGLQNGHQAGHQIGRQEGGEEGLQLARREMAKKLVARGMTDSDIADITGLYLEDIRKLRGAGH